MFKLLIFVLFFLVQGNVSGDTIPDSKYIENLVLSMQADFQKLLEENQLMKNENLALKNRIEILEETKIAFAASRTYKLSEQGEESELIVGQGDLIYDYLELNDGNAFDQMTGIFKAPLSGSYHFTLTGVCGSPCILNVMKNGQVYNENQIVQFRDFNNIAYSMSMELKEGDEINVQVNYGNVVVGQFDYEDCNCIYVSTPINFSGFLI